MIELNVTFFIQLVNFLILLAVLNLILYRPIRGILQQRRERLAGYLSDIERFTKGAEEKLKNYEEDLAKARVEGSKIRNEFKALGTKEEQQIMAEAKQEAQKKLEEVRADLNAQVEQAKKELYSEVETYANMVAEKVLA